MRGLPCMLGLSVVVNLTFRNYVHLARPLPARRARPASEATTCTLSVAHRLGATRRSPGAFSLPSSKQGAQTVRQNHSFRHNKQSQTNHFFEKGSH